MCQSIINKVPEIPLFIGLYNPYHDIFYTCEELTNQFSDEDTPIVFLPANFLLRLQLIFTKSILRCYGYIFPIVKLD